MTMTIEERVQKLERELRQAQRLTRWFFAGFGLVVVGVFLSKSTQAQGVPDEFRAHGFVVADDTGRRRGVFGWTPAGVILELEDENGRSRVNLMASSTGPLLAFSDARGKQRVFLTAFSEGPSRMLADRDGHVRARLGAATFKAPDGTTTTYPESSLVLRGPNGKVLSLAPQ